MNKEIIIQDKQSIFDVAVQNYGNADAVFELIKLNSDCGIDKQLKPGDIIIVDKKDDAKTNYLNSKNIATDANSEVSAINWILKDGCWNDDGVWVDFEPWNDWCGRWVLESNTWDDGKTWDDIGIWNN